jgi:hypothetical protein
MSFQLEAEQIVAKVQASTFPAAVAFIAKRLNAVHNAGVLVGLESARQSFNTVFDDLTETALKE